MKHAADFASVHLGLGVFKPALKFSLQEQHVILTGIASYTDCVTPGNEGEDMPKTEVPWQGCISWSWRKTAAVHGKFQACFIPAALCSPGASWSNKGDSLTSS